MRVFLFGSRSEFNQLCHLTISSLKEKYKNIKYVLYTCKSEYCLLEKNKTKLKKILVNFIDISNDLLFYDEEFERAKKYASCKASFAGGNQALINDSDYCVFYYDKNYIPVSKQKTVDKYSYTKSGTVIAYKYAEQRKKTIISVFTR